MQDKNIDGGLGGMMVLTPFSEGSKPDAFKFMLCGAFLCLIAICTFFMYRPEPFIVQGSIKIFYLGIAVSLAAGGTLFCRVELGEGQIVSKGFFGKKTIMVSRVESVRYQPAATFTQLVVRTDTDSVMFSSLSFSARQLNAIRNYCEQSRQASQES